MQLDILLNVIDLPPSNTDTEVKGLAIDSRNVRQGYLFAALPGTAKNGIDFIPDALKRGACALIVPTSSFLSSVPPTIHVIRVPDARTALAKIAAYFWHPLPKYMVAVTGTNGKTSTVDFTRQIWLLRKHKAASIGTLGIINKEGIYYKTALTTPDSLTLSQQLHQLTTMKISHVALEASSHGLDQKRLDGLTFQHVGITNITRDHLDYHGNFSAYLDAKLHLLDMVSQQSGVVVLNTEMDNVALQAFIQKSMNLGTSVRTVGSTGDDIHLLSTEPIVQGTKITVIIDKKYRKELILPLIGNFQVDNALMAVLLTKEEEMSVYDSLELLSQLKGVRGRIEHVANFPNGSSAYVDYAHTPDALARLLQSVRRHCHGRIICVFGAGGDRDHGKRPLMGQEAHKYADIVIVTDDNPRTERPNTIRQAILQGIPDAIEVGDRQEAIMIALTLLRKDDVLIVAGKGHETSQIIGTTKLHFDDTKVIRQNAKKLWGTKL